MGIMLPDKNAFDFVEKVERRDEGGKDQERKKQDDSGRQKLQKTLLNLKKQNSRQTSSNKNMATVKLTY